jgi:N-acetyltransferase
MNPTTTPDWTAHPLIEGRFLRLEPLSLDHAPYWQRYYDPNVFEFQGRGGPKSGELDDIKAFLQPFIEQERRLNWSLRLLDTGEIAGRMSMSDMRSKQRALEIGTTIFTPFQGTFVNPEAKYLLLQRAFEVLDCLRVQFFADARNAKSLRALEKLGATKEGVLRKYQIRPDGYVRDSAIFSILDSEWPTIKSALETRLGYPINQ